MNNAYDSLIRKLEGTTTWGLKISVAGMTLEFGSRRTRTKGCEHGHFTVWIVTRYRVVIARKPLLKANYPLPEHVNILEPSLIDKVVVRAGIDLEDNSLRILFAGEGLLSAFPNLASTEMPWVFFDRKLGPDERLIAYKDGFEERFSSGLSKKPDP